MKKFTASILLLVLCGCAALQKGADPAVVRTEQTLSIAKSTLDTFEQIDNANRAFFHTNAPAMHAFAEYLRAPVIVNGTNVLPRGLAFIMALDTVKLQYKAGKASSNALATASAVLESALSQAQNFIAQQQPNVRTNTP